MPDEDGTTPEASAEADAPELSVEDQLKAAQAEAEKWKGLSRKHETRAKSNEAAAKRVEEMEAASKSEVERLQDAAKTASQRADEAEQRATRYEVAADKGVPAKLLKFITGSDREAMEESADELLEAIGNKADDTPASDGTTTNGGKPREALKSGAANVDEPEETDPRKLAASIPRDSNPLA